MGVAFRHEDILKGRKRLIEAGLRDVSPGVRKNVIRILETWDGNTSEEKLSTLVGERRTKRIKELLKR